MIYTHDYDIEYDPPIPVVEVHINRLGRKDGSMSLIALVDSGADGTMIPVEYIHAIDARRTGRAYLRGVTGSGSAVDIYEVAMRIGPYHVPKVRVVADKKNREVILGRDVLNQLIVTLNGLAHAVEISQ